MSEIRAVVSEVSKSQLPTSIVDNQLWCLCAQIDTLVSIRAVVSYRVGCKARHIEFHSVLITSSQGCAILVREQAAASKQLRASSSEQAASKQHRASSSE